MEINIKDKKLLLYDDSNIEGLTENITEEMLKHEASIIKDNFTEEEIQMLVNNMNQVDGSNIHSCIYGTMLGTCYHPRVLKVMKKLPVLLISQATGENSLKADESRLRNVFTPIETYIIPVNSEFAEYFYEDEDKEEFLLMDIGSYSKRVKKIVDLLTNN